MRVMLINPVAKRFKLGKSIMPPLGLAMIAAVLEQEGIIEVSILDCMVEGYDFADLQRAVAAAAPDIVGITSTTYNRFDSFDTCTAVREVLPKATVVFGGVHATFTAQDTLEHIPAIDIVCRGEGEITFLEMVRVLAEGSDPSEVQGLSYRDGDRIVHNSDRLFIHNLDALPLPARHLLPMEKYNQTLPFLDEVPAALVMTSRGCPVRCVFCSTGAMWGLRCRSRSPEHVADEIERLIAQYGAEGVWFFDDTLTFRRSHIEGLLREFERRNLKFPWYCEIRVDTVDYDLLKRMRDTGCYYVSFGVESASPRVLRAINKRITIPQVEQVIAWCRELGILMKAFFILGLPEETYEEALQTVSFIKKHKEDFAFTSLSCSTNILPGTRVEWFAKENGYLAPGFSWSEPYYVAKNLTLGENPYVPLLIQPQMGYTELVNLKYKALAKELLNWRGMFRVLKRLTTPAGIHQGYWRKYSLEALEILQWVFHRRK